MNNVRKFTEYISLITEDTNNQLQGIYFATDCKRDYLESKRTKAPTVGHLPYSTESPSEALLPDVLTGYQMIV